uniref:GPI inositol-deacylase n=1 Tax=Sinocyclocheilus rhinocerous TaxID=307959 RepID=A0A673N6A2_9TELE
MRLALYAFCGFAFGLLLVGLRELLFGFGENRCSMTYMFEYPEYRVSITLPKRVARQYPSYGLYLYGEGAYAQETRGLKLTGAPVLFLPGNAGSYKQARSLGSVALRKAENLDRRIHMNVFTIDFNEELVALYGGSLRRQTQFLHESIKAILRLYKDRPDPPTGVVLVGHSMGGVVARALFTLARFNPRLVSLIITQASPHQAPVLSLDPYILEFYSTVRHRWATNAEDLRNVTVLSVGGGYLDFQVRSGLTALSCPIDDLNKMSVVATAVPRTWVSTDHISIVWCKELVLATVRAFFDLIEPETGQFTESPEKRMSVLNYHFFRHPVLQPGGAQDAPVTFSGLCLRAPMLSKCLISLTVSVQVPHVLSFGEPLNCMLVFAFYFQGIYQMLITITSHCKTTKDRLPSVYRLRVPWFREDSFDTASIPSVSDIYSMLHTSRPDNASSALLQLHTAPNCQYKVSIRTSFPKVLGQVCLQCGISFGMLLTFNLRVFLIFKRICFSLDSVFLWSSSACLFSCSASSDDQGSADVLFLLNQAPQKVSQKSENGFRASDGHSKVKECNGSPLLTESVLQDVRDDLQLHFSLSTLLTLTMMLTVPSLIHWRHNLR